jgi:hypothetical protein
MTRPALAPAAAPAVVLAAALLVAGCGEGGGGEPRNVTRIAVENEHHDGLLALSEPMRNLALMRAVRDSGINCRRVDRGAYQEPYRGMAMWVARCEDGRDWAVFIAPSGDIQVRSCAEAGQLGLPECRLDEAYARMPAAAGGAEAEGTAQTGS